MAGGSPDQFSRITITLVGELDEQGHFLLRELQRTRARVNHRWPIPEHIGEDTDIVLCQFVPDLSRRYTWMPGEANAAGIALLPQNGLYDMRPLEAALPDAVLHRAYLPHAVLTALSIAWDHFSFCRRQRVRIARLDETIRSLRDIERAKHLIMADNLRPLGAICSTRTAPSGTTGR
ncbi:ANTAR domain-containing protein [Mesorhizobium shangrilense]|uniref:ANTAR domain-containing protein n=1 Tax=Mesorhizobium shangrilense TaxID=460060 RepID=A0ABV2DLZ6_9HYPH